MSGPAAPRSFTCPVCGRTSYHPRDADEGYCGACHAFTDSPDAVEAALARIRTRLARTLPGTVRRHLDRPVDNS